MLVIVMREVVGTIDDGLIDEPEGYLYLATKNAGQEFFMLFLVENAVYSYTSQYNEHWSVGMYGLWIR
jgi:hypothetical protein